MKEDVKDFVRSMASTLVARLPRTLFTDPKVFEIFQSRGWHMVPVHFYSPIPNTRELPERLWKTRSAMVGVDMAIDRQRALLEALGEVYLKEYLAIPDEVPPSPTEYTRKSHFTGIDGGLLYCMIRRFKPRRIIEIGAGQSTLLSLLALRRNAEEHPAARGELTSIEPYPSDLVRSALSGVGRLIVEKVEDVSLQEFEALGENDILFIDSSHTVRVGGDVVHELLEIVPRLAPGVLIHVHDIFLPLPYPKEWVVGRQTFWAEQYLLQAFLAFNRDFEVLWSAGLMQADSAEQVARHFPGFDPEARGGGSFWFRRCR
jgi:predicted O-methyltransferase YrrM